MTKLLLHCCCGPCATYCVSRLRAENFDVGAFWYNPNIHPFMEHKLRLEATQTLSQKMEFPLIVAEGYDMIDYFRGVVGNEGARCGHCFRMRMEKTAQAAKENGFDSFTTTLFISPYQKHELLKDICKAISKEYNVDFYYDDFRTGFRESQQLSREMELYRQKYCGCVYSEWERFGKVNIEKMMGGRGE